MIFDHITFEPRIMGGACIRGMRILVSVLVRHIAHGASAEVRARLADLQREDIQ